MKHPCQFLPPKEDEIGGIFLILYLTKLEKHGRFKSRI